MFGYQRQSSCLYQFSHSELQGGQKVVSSGPKTGLTMLCDIFCKTLAKAESFESISQWINNVM